jgi:chromosome segregation ATPase
MSRAYLRQDLNSCGYFEPFTMESASLIERLLVDVVSFGMKLQDANNAKDQMEREMLQERKHRLSVESQMERFTSLNETLSNQVAELSKKADESILKAERECELERDKFEQLRLLFEQQALNEGRLEMELAEMRRKMSQKFIGSETTFLEIVDGEPFFDNVETIPSSLPPVIDFDAELAQENFRLKTALESEFANLTTHPTLAVASSLMHRSQTSSTNVNDLQFQLDYLNEKYAEATRRLNDTLPDPLRGKVEDLQTALEREIRLRKDAEDRLKNVFNVNTRSRCNRPDAQDACMGCVKLEKDLEEAKAIIDQIDQEQHSHTPSVYEDCMNCSNYANELEQLQQSFLNFRANLSQVSDNLNEELAFCKAEIDQKNILVKECSNQMNELTSYVNSLTEENEAFQKSLMEMSEDRDKLITQIRSISIEKHQLEQKIADGFKTDMEISHFKQKCQTTETELKKVLVEKHACEDRLAKSNSRIEQLMTDLQIVSNQCGSLEELIEGINQTKNQLEIKLQQSERELDEERKRMKILVNEDAGGKVEISRLKTEISDLHNVSMRMDHERDKLQSLCDDQAEELDLLQQENRKMGVEFYEMQRICENLKRQCEQYTRECEDAVESKKAVEIRYQRATEECQFLSNALAECRRSLVDMESDLTVLAKENEKSRELQMEAFKQVEILTLTIKSKDKSLADILHALRATEMERDDILGLYRRLAEEANKSDAFRSDLSKEKLQLEEAVQILQKQIEDEQMEKASLKNKLRQSELDIVALKRQIANLSAQTEQLLATTEEGRKGIAAAVKDLEMTEKINKQVEQHRENFQREAARLLAEKTELEMKLNKVETSRFSLETRLKQEMAKSEALQELIGNQRKSEILGQSSEGSDNLQKTVEQQFVLIGELDRRNRELEERLLSDSNVANNQQL